MSGLAATADLGGLLDRLVSRAARLGSARARELSLAQREPERVWRSPGLLWPLFTKGAE